MAKKTKGVPHTGEFQDNQAVVAAAVDAACC